MLSLVRKNSFWTLDKAKGSKIRSAYEDIKRFYELDSTSPYSYKFQSQQIKRLFAEATNHTKFYQEYADRLELADFPVVNKNFIRDNQESFMSQKYQTNELFKMSTSGSTGTPFTSYQNLEKKRRVNAEAIFFNGLAGYEVGNKLIHLRSLNIINQKSKLKQFVQNERLIDIDKLDNPNIRMICKEIENLTQNSGGTALSYASTYDALADYFNKNGTDIIGKSKINGIISTSELLYDNTRHTMMKAFACDAYSRYANMENGILGQDNPNHPNTFIMNEASYYFEILKMGSDEPVEQGELGRIVVTDLFNYAMPMIRYDTGDVGTFTMVKVNGKEKKGITDFGGRQIDMIFDSNGQYISPHKISVTFWEFEEVKEFQFIQVSKKDYQVLLNIEGEFTKQNLLKDKLLEVLGVNANIMFKKVKAIPTLNSGKRKYIMNKTL
ncbi:phenylacetate--CoA ligase family protein [Oceanobacillus sp. CFH 90083]|uniref:phenylacetate--CoA ligase family protein n=1 Tax=Oceanobacillus sp. CFH 90083 TaxID=2592336 RepID=UPI00128D5BA2|nr:phenylacetate--CoA ligase family protein [Oceanobacillus sp. CFH 90083]